jgi:hypothetical protein
MLKVSLDELVKLLEQLVRWDPAAGNEVIEVISFAGVIRGCRSSIEDVDLHAVTDVEPGVYPEAVSRSFWPSIGVAKEPVVMPERCFEDSPLVAKEALEVGLIGLGHTPRLFEERREADCLLAID